MYSSRRDRPRTPAPVARPPQRESQDPAEAIFAEGDEHAVGGRRSTPIAQRLKQPGDPNAGASVFKRGVRSLPSPAKRGGRGGPRPGRSDRQVAESLLVAILDPNRALEAKYTNFTVQTQDGRILTGLIASETATSVTLRRQEGKEDVLLRADIEAMAASGKSLMPEGLEKDLKPRASST